MPAAVRPGLSGLIFLLSLGLGCTSDQNQPPVPDEPSPTYRNIDTPTDYVGDSACTECHEEAAAAYATHAMAKSFHRWTPDDRVEPVTDEPLPNEPTGFFYTVVEDSGALYQEEYLLGPDGRRLHELRRRIDYVMGSGHVARSYFTEENGRLFELPLTWYRNKGWDFSPGYEVNNARFDRLLPDRCIACHGSYPTPYPFLEGKYAALGPGIGCERCHGPGALHVRERSSGIAADSGYDDTIVNPHLLSLERRLDVCEQCHVHAPVEVLREGRDAFSYRPSLPLQDQVAFFKTSGSIDIVSHADRLRQSACFQATRPTARPLECATCHDPHQPEVEGQDLNKPCRDCHQSATLAARLAGSDFREDHETPTNCVGCHMPRVQERNVPHGSFTDHWIRVITRPAERERSPSSTDRPIEPYFERDRSGPESAIYRGMGRVVYATLANDPRQLGEAAELLGAALAGDSTRGDAYFLLGLADRRLGRIDDAVAALERSLRVDPDRPQRLHALAQASEASGFENQDSVASLYAHALRLQPALAWIRADYAEFLLDAGRLSEAEAAFRQALAERPSLDVATFTFGTLMTELGRPDEAADLFERAVQLNPSLAEGLAPLLEVRASRGRVTGVQIMPLPLETLPARYRGPNATGIALGSAVRARTVRFVDVPMGGTVRIVEPDGSVVRVLTPGEDGTASWDLLTAAGDPIGSGLHHVLILGRDASGRPLPPQRFSFGVVRQRGP